MCVSEWRARSLAGDARHGRSGPAAPGTPPAAIAAGGGARRAPGSSLAGAPPRTGGLLGANGTALGTTGAIGSAGAKPACGTAAGAGAAGTGVAIGPANAPGACGGNPGRAGKAVIWTSGGAAALAVGIDTGAMGSTSIPRGAGVDECDNASGGLAPATGNAMEPVGKPRGDVAGNVVYAGASGGKGTVPGTCATAVARAFGSVGTPCGSGAEGCRPAGGALRPAIGGGKAASHVDLVPTSFTARPRGGGHPPPGTAGCACAGPGGMSAGRLASGAATAGAATRAWRSPAS